MSVLTIKDHMQEIIDLLQEKFDDYNYQSRYQNIKDYNDIKPEYEEIYEQIIKEFESDYVAEKYIGTIEIIYYENAMKFLTLYDPSLTESLQLVENAGFKLSNINSEILSTSLLQYMLMEKWEEEKESIYRKIKEEYFREFWNNCVDYINSNENKE